jgi:quercetin dioxygenase-like cupin family protein
VRPREWSNDDFLEENTYMSNKPSLAVVVALVFVAGVAIGQLSYPDADDPAVVLENDHVIVQKFDSQPGDWVGMHQHGGNQLVVILKEAKLMYKEGGKEEEREFKAGDVFWIDEVEHDHKAITKGGAVIVTVK